MVGIRTESRNLSHSILFYSFHHFLNHSFEEFALKLIETILFVCFFGMDSSVLIMHLTIYTVDRREIGRYHWMLH